MDPLTLPVTPELLDRAIGVVVASAVGDALGAAYEFGGPVNPDAVSYTHLTLPTIYSV